MFRGSSAWFSGSVSRERIHIWEENHGIIESQDDAMFLFSENSNKNDTQEIFKSDAYLNDHIAIFHASYIDECMRCGNMKDVAIGKYFLPPSQIYKSLKDSVSFQWNYEYQEGNDPVASGSKEVNINEEHASHSETRQNIHARKAQDKRHSTSPKKRHSTSPKKRHSTSPKRHSTSPEKESSNIGKKRTPKILPGFVHIDTLPKVSGNLEDFIIGKNGCEVKLKT